MRKSNSRIGRRRGTARTDNGRKQALITILVSALFICLLVWIFVFFGILQSVTKEQNDNTSMDSSKQNKPSIITISEKENHPSRSFPPRFPVVTRSNSSVNALDKEAVTMCSHTLWHTLETTTIVLPNEETFIHTGDIDDLWLRDSAAQVHPLLVPFFNDGTSSLVQEIGRAHV